MAQVFSAALFLLLAIASVLPFALAIDPKGGVASRLGIYRECDAYKRFTGESVKLELEDEMSVVLSVDGSDDVTAQLFRKGEKIGKVERVTEPALVVKKGSLVFIGTESQSITIPSKKMLEKKSSTKEHVIWKIDEDEAKLITTILIGDEAAATPFGLAFAKHIEVNNGMFSNGEDDWRGKGVVKLIRYDEKIYTYATEKKELGWRSVTKPSGVITVKGLRSEQKTVRIDAVDGWTLEIYDITFKCSAELGCVFAAMYDLMPCIRKRRAEVLFKRPWETIEKYARSETVEADTLIRFEVPSAGDPIVTPMCAALIEERPPGTWKEYIGNLLLKESTDTDWIFNLAWQKNYEAFRVHYKADEEYGWKFEKWDNWSQTLVSRIIREQNLSGFENIPAFTEGFFVEHFKHEENESIIGKYFSNTWGGSVGFEVHVDCENLVAFCGKKEGTKRFFVDEATWESKEESGRVRNVLSKVFRSLAKKQNVLTLSGRKIEKEVERAKPPPSGIEKTGVMQVKLIFLDDGDDERVQKFIKCEVVSS
eukprot:GHVS01065503.1.p1 GENE.GHVS01065503.1~~GHVS01065503.1.p1  ORF type:complete len:568 (+),score=62.13 GHVS01065503.1:96-1706(+)